MESGIYNNTNNITNVPELRGTSDYWDAVSIKIEHCFYKMGLVVRKPVFGVSDQVTHKPGCTVTEDS